MTTDLQAVRRRKRYPAYKDSGVEWLGKVPEHWSIARLKTTVIGCQNGVWGKEPDGANDFICVRVADFDRTRLSVNLGQPTLRRIDESERRTRTLTSGDLLLEKSGGGELQPVGAVVLFDQDELAMCSNFIARMQVAKNYSPRYLTYLHFSLYATRINVRSIKQSTGIQNLDSDSYLNERVSIPTIDEQEAIAAFLDRQTAKIDALVAKKERLIELLIEKRAALITQAVTKGLPSTGSAGSGQATTTVPMKDSGIEWLGQIPAHWKVLQLNRVIDKFVDYRGATPEKASAGIPLVTARNIKNAAIDMDLSSEFIREEDYDDWMVRGMPEVGDVLLTTEASLGESAQITDTRVALAQRIILLKANRNRITNDYLKYHFASHSGIGELWSRATGSTAIGIKAYHLRQTFLTVPPLNEQEAIGKHIDYKTAKIDALIAKVREGIEKLKEYRTALISAAVTGKIDVRGSA